MGAKVAERAAADIAVNDIPWIGDFRDCPVKKFAFAGVISYIPVFVAGSAAYFVPSFAIFVSVAQFSTGGPARFVPHNCVVAPR